MICSCGPDWLPSKLTHWYLNVPKDGKCFFHEACLQHDKNYAEGKLTRKEADEIFYHTMVEMAALSNATIKQKLQATKYYYWVRYWGGISYFKHNGRFN